MTMSAHEVLRIIEENAPAIRALGVRSLALFGSAARGAAREDSDLDFVVEFDAKTFDAYMDLKALLEQLLGRRVDLVLRDALKPRLRESVLSQALHAPGL
jgi:predicted nucleotidyltransferase